MRPIDEQSNTAPYLALPQRPARSKRFLSGRWRVLTPVMAVLMAVLMCATYGFSSLLVRGESQQNGQDNLIASSQAVAHNALTVGQSQRAEVDRIAFTEGVGLAITEGNGAAIQPLVEPLAAIAQLDLVVVGNAEPQELLGMQRVSVAGSIDYEVTQQSDLNAIRAVQSVLGGADSASEIIAVERRTMLVTAGPVLLDGQVVGIVLVGQDLNKILLQLQDSPTSELALFVSAGQNLRTTLGSEDVVLDPEVYTNALSQNGAASLERVILGEQPYQAAYFPFVIGQTPLGVVGVYHAEESTFASDAGRQLFSLLMALVVGAVCITVYWAAGRQFARVDRLRQTVDLMATGADIRTNTKPHDEIGELGAAVDRFAAAARLQVKQLQSEVRQQRRQATHLNSIFEHLKDGLILQDADGRVLSMNGSARTLLGVGGQTQEALALREWASQANHKALELAAGLFALQETTHIQLNGRIVMVSAALVESIADKQVGKVVLLRDVTDEAQRGAQRDALVDELAQNVHLSMTQRAQLLALEASTQPATAHINTLQEFAKEIAQDARAMQRMISDYQELTLLQANELRQRQHPIAAIDLLTVLAEEWAGAASAANLQLNLTLPDSDDWFVLGDEKRLLMALGNLVENAVKYNEGGGALTLSVQAYEEQSRLVIKIQDQGVGIHPDDLPQIFTRFFRGTPRKQTGEVLEVMGTGQGLFFAQKIIQAHGGEIVLASHPSQGTQISVWLPLSAGEALELSHQAYGVADTSSHSLWDMPTHAALKAAKQ